MDELPPPRLRGVNKSDLDAIAELELTAFGIHSLARGALDVMFDLSGGLWLLAEDDEGVWGHAINARAEDPHVGWIAGMSIHPARQRQGWGAMLVATTIDYLRCYGSEVIRLLVKPNNKVARRLYENFGFIYTGERIDHFGTDEPRVLMSLLLLQQTPDISEVRGPQIPADPDCF